MRPWRSVEVAIVLPIATAHAVFARAHAYDLAHGGRFDARSAAILLWSAPEAVADAEPIGCFYMQWRTPSDEQATIYQLEWDPVAGSEAEVRRAIAVLGGPGGG